MEGFRRVLAPVDFTSASSQVLEMAYRVVHPEGVVLLLHVVEWVPTVIEGAFGGYARPKEMQALHDDARKRLEEWAHAREGRRTEVEVVENAPAPGILEAAERFEADLIVVGTHSRRGLSQLLLGRVTERVLRQARCPVLAVRTSETPRS